MGQFAAPHPGYKSGRYYWPIPAASIPATAGTAPAANTLYFCPFYLFSDVSISALVMANTGTAENGKKVRLGVYSNVDGEPGALEISGAEITLTASAATTETAATGSLIKGWHFFALLMDSAGAAITVVASPGTVLPGPIWGQRGSQLGTTAGQAAITLQATQTYGALPSTAPALASTGTTLVPYIVFKVA